MPGVALFDGDGTLHEGYTIFPVYQAFADEKFISKADNAKVQEVYDAYANGEIGFKKFVKNSLVNAAEAVRGRRVDVAKHLTEIFFAEENHNWFGYVEPTIKLFQEARYHTGLITAAPEFIGNTIRKSLNMRFNYTSDFGIYSDGDELYFCGNVNRIVTDKRKNQFTNYILDVRFAARGGDNFGFGDSQGDIGMLQSVDKPYCIRPTKKLHLHALENGWPIVEDPYQPLSDFDPQ